MLSVTLIDPENRENETSARRGGANVGPCLKFPEPEVIKKLQVALEKEAAKPAFFAVGSSGMKDKVQGATFFKSFCQNVLAVVRKALVQSYNTGKGSLKKNSAVRMHPFCKIAILKRNLMKFDQDYYHHCVLNH